MNFDLIKSARMKFDRSLFDAAVRSLGDKVSPEQSEQFAGMMLNRLMVGECRYEGSKWLYFDRDQEESIGKNWRYGYTFYDWDPELFSRAADRKAAAYRNTGNTEFLVDVANYCAFQALTSETADRALLVEVVAACVDEFFHPNHPNAHYSAADQGIDGTEYSGSASNDPAVRARMRANG